MIESAKVLNFIVVILGSGYNDVHFEISPCIGNFDYFFASCELLSLLHAFLGKVSLGKVFP